MSSEVNGSANNTELPIFPEWFKENYPKEYYFYNQIQDRLNTICSQIPVKLNVGDIADITIKITKLEDKIFRLVTNPYGMIFLGTLGRALVDESNNNLEASISDAVRKEIDMRLFSVQCKECNTMNVINSKYCNKCSKSLA